MNASIYTGKGHNMFEVSSLIQKAIRRGHKDYALYAANELMPRYRNYLWKRLLVVSAEDCYDLITNKIISLKQADDAQAGQQKSPMFIAKAVSLLLNARKNRDADYFACNLLNSRDRQDLSVCGIEASGDIDCCTKNGHGMFDVASALQKSIQAYNVEIAGYAANELMVRYRKFLWKQLVLIAKDLGFRQIDTEILALKIADDMQPTTSPKSSIFVAKALVTILKVSKYRRVDFYISDFAYDNVNIRDYDNKRMTIPDYVFDCHTHRGRQMGKTKKDFIVAEQSALIKFQGGEFDNLGWDRYFYLEKNGFYDKDNVAPRPEAGRMKELEDGCVQRNLFD